MKKLILLSLAGLFLLGIAADAQETYFGKNKVRYRDFDWHYIQSRHFDIYYYEDAYETAKFTSVVMESSYVEISEELGYKLQNRIPIFIYNSHNDFQQTNITPGILPEGVGGFTEAFKKRIVIPFTGSYEDYRHVLHHELTHGVVFDMLFGNLFSSMLARQRIFNVPLWYAEGYAEYSSRHGWDYFADMFVRDATINGYLTPPQYLGGFLAYKQGQAMVKYIADEYGEENLGDILRKGKVHLSMSRALKETIGKTEEEFWKEFSKEMKRRHWPEIAKRKEANEIGRQLTKARQDGSYFNEKPVYSPDGDRLVMFTDRSDYTELVLISAKDGELIDALVKSQRSGDLESLHSYVSGASFSPDGRRLVFVAKSDGQDALVFLNIDNKEVYFKKRFEFNNILNPHWSPDGNKVLFSALRGYKRDLYVYHIDTDVTERLTDDRYDDSDASWLPDSKGIVFESDRPHPTSPMIDGEGHMYVHSGAHMPGDFEYGNYNLFRLNLGSPDVTPLDFGPGQNKTPRVSPDGEKVAFISNRNGIDNIYIGYLDSTNYYAVTDILTGVRSISWSPDSRQIAYSAFYRGGFDIFILRELVPQGEDGVLEPTDFASGRYDRLVKIPEAPKLTDDTAVMASTSLSPDSLSAEYETYAVDPDTLEAIASADDTVTVDTVQVGDDSTAVITETGVYDDGYVYVGEDDTDALDSLMLTVGADTASFGRSTLQEPAIFDSIPDRLPGGEFEVQPYETKFTADFIGGGLAYDTFFGLRGQTVFLFSDYLGDQTIYVATDLVNSLDQSYLQGYYFNTRQRTGYGLGIFHTKNFYIQDVGGRDFLFSDRFYGFSVLFNRPWSTFKRLEWSLSQIFIDREYLNIDDTRENRSSKVTSAQLSYVKDNVIWGFTGPVNGTRAKVTLEGGINLFDSDDVEFYAVGFDYRKYWHFSKTFSMAFRVAGGASFGETPKRYFLGGTTNYIGNRTVDADVFEVENLYFADVVTPLRGLDYYDLEGNRFGLVNWEFRFPMIEYFAMRFPLPIVLQRVMGAMFVDVGSAWFDDDFKGATSEGGRDRLQDIKTGFGFGFRANLGFLLLRYDLAWTTDFYEVSAKPQSYFSFGADF